MKSLFRRLVLVVAAAWIAGLGGRLIYADTLPIRTRRFPPKVMRYDPDKDEFRHAKSVTNPVSEGRTKGNVSFHGNRLTQFRFLGPRERSGIYGAMDDYKAKKKLDPANYRYHW